MNIDQHIENEASSVLSDKLNQTDFVILHVTLGDLISLSTSISEHRHASLSIYTLINKGGDYWRELKAIMHKRMLPGEIETAKLEYFKLMRSMKAQKKE